MGWLIVAATYAVIVAFYLRLGLHALSWWEAVRRFPPTAPRGIGAFARAFAGAAVEVAQVCDRIAAKQGVTRSAVLLAWEMRHPAGVVPIIGTTQVERIRECARAVDVELTRDEWYEIFVAARGEAMP